MSISNVPGTLFLCVQSIGSKIFSVKDIHNVIRFQCTPKTDVSSTEDHVIVEVILAVELIQTNKSTLIFLITEIVAVLLCIDGRSTLKITYIVGEFQLLFKGKVSRVFAIWLSDIALNISTDIAAYFKLCIEQSRKEKQA